MAGRRAREEVERLNEVERHLRKVIAQQGEQAHALQLHCNEFEQVVQHRDTMIEALSAELNLSENTISERDGQIAEMNQVVAERDRMILEYRESTSWKVTAPLRWPVHQVKRVRHLLRIVPEVAKQQGGIKVLTLKVLKVIRPDGLKGVKYRLRNLGNKPVVIESTNKVVDRNDYAEWIRRYDTMTDSKRSAMRGELEKFDQQPLISVVMPTYNPDPAWLTEAIESVQNQIYPNWELCIADDASTMSGVRTLLQKHAGKDERIKIVFREENGHISATSNSALKLAIGDWIALLDHDDLLSEHALFWVVEAMNRHPEARLIYSDEDKIDGSGHRSSPYFKPDWNPDIFLSHNHICHLGVYKASLVRDTGGFREGLEGAQDYDLALRCIERISPAHIIHVPRVLYHWRIHSGSTALAGSEKNYALVAGERALNDHFHRKNISARSELLDFGMYRVHYTLPSPLPFVSMIIPTYNGLQLIRQCIDSLLAKTSYANYEIIVVDNNSDDPDVLRYFELISSDDRIRILRDERPFNFSQLNNTAVEKSKGEFVLLLNNDIEVISPDWLSEMVGLAIQPGAGCVGARLWYPDDTLQHGGVIGGIGGVAGHSHKHLPRGDMGYFGRAGLIQSLIGVTAACLLVRKDIYLEAGGLNEVDLTIAFNDVDFCLRVRAAGYRNIWTPYAELYHHESATRGYEDTPEKKRRFKAEVLYMQKRWSGILMNDPAYSPNLTLDFDDFSLAWPPRVRL